VDDILLFVDAFDVLFFGGEDEIIRLFEEMEQETGRSLLFNAEKACFPAAVCEGYPMAPFPRWRYLNSGAIIGRAWAFRRMLPEPVSDVIKHSDQAWYQRYFRNHTDLVALDTRCKLLFAVMGVGGSEDGVEFQDGRLLNTMSGNRPLVVHFVSYGHWPAWREDGVPTSTLHEVFRKLHPDVADRLLERMRIDVAIFSTHSERLLALRGKNLETFLAFMRAVLCFECRVLGTGQHECQHFDSLTGPFCLTFTVVTTGLIAAFGIWLAARLLGRHRLRTLLGLHCFWRPTARMLSRPNKGCKVDRLEV